MTEPTIERVGSTTHSLSEYEVPAYNSPMAENRKDVFEVVSYDNYPSFPEQTDDGQLLADERDFSTLRVTAGKPNDVAFIFAASLIVLISAARACSGMEQCPYEGSVNYAVAVGSVSMVVSGVYILVYKYNSTLASTYSQFVSCFLLIWWAVGASIMTFNEPFSDDEILGNGYFASWLAFAMSGSFVWKTVDWISRQRDGMRPPALSRAIVFFILMASFIEIIAASIACGEREVCSNDYAFAVVSGVFSASTCIVHLLGGGKIPVNVVAGFLGFWWMVSIGVLTLDVDDAFGYAGNGYFAIWCCFLGSFYFCYHIFLGGN